jgi:hypothetical protein
MWEILSASSVSVLQISTTGEQQRPVQMKRWYLGICCIDDAVVGRALFVFLTHNSMKKIASYWKDESAEWPQKTRKVTKSLGIGLCPQTDLSEYVFLGKVREKVYQTVACCRETFLQVTGQTVEGVVARGWDSPAAA